MPTNSSNVAQADANSQLVTYKIMYNSEINVGQNIIAKLNTVMPKTFKCSTNNTRIGVINYKASDHQ